MLDALTPLLAALTRLLVARGVAFPELAERLKAHYVAAALRDASSKPTDSRISVQTGLQRRDIARLRAEDLKEPRISHLARLVTIWQTDPAYGQATGGARALERSEFDALAPSVRKDIHPRTQLDALKAAGTVALDETADRVVLRSAAYLPAAGSDDQLAYLANNTGDHLEAAAQNVLGRTPPYFERALHYGDLSKEEVAELTALADKLHMQSLEALRQRAADMKRSQPRPPLAEAQRLRTGAFVYSGEEDDT